VVAPVPLQTVCLRHIPVVDGAPLEGEVLDEHTLAWCERVNATGRAFVTPAVIGGRWTVRVSIGAEATELADVEELWSLCRGAVVPA
jgi:aromatic-L-amino-acid decarboxylase